MAPFIKGQWPTPDSPSSTDNNGIFIDVHTNRATVGYGIGAFTERNPLAWPSFATAADVAGSRPSSSASMNATPCATRASSSTGCCWRPASRPDAVR